MEKKSKKKMPIWVTIIIAIIIAIAIICGIGALTRNEFNEKSNEYKQKSIESLQKGKNTYSPETILNK